MRLSTHQEYLLDRAQHCRASAEGAASAAVRRIYLGFAAQYEAEAKEEFDLEALQHNLPLPPIALR